MSTDLASQWLASCLQSARFNTFTSDGVKNISVLSSLCDGGRKEAAAPTSQTSAELTMTRLRPGVSGEKKSLNLCHR